MSVTIVDLRTGIHKGECDDDERSSSGPNSSGPTFQATKAVKDSENNRTQSTELYDPPVISSKDGEERQPSRSGTKYHDPLYQADDNDDDSDSLDSLEQTRLGERSNVPFITDLEDTSHAKNLPAKASFVDNIEAIYKYISSVDGLKNWLWGSQYEKLLPVTRTKGKGWRKLEGREYKSVALEFEYREGTGSSSANGKG